MQAHSDVNKMSVQNLATVFGPNILRPQIEDPVTIMEGKGQVAWQCPELEEFGLVLVATAQSQARRSRA